MITHTFAKKANIHNKILKYTMEVKKINLKDKLLTLERVCCIMLL